MAQYEKLINLSLLNQFLTKAKTIFAPKITASGILKGDGAGGVTAATAGTDYATPALVKVSDTQPTETENKLWVDTDAGSGNSYQVPTVAESLAMGISGAKVGDLVRVNSVDSKGKPTSWRKAPLCEIKCNKNLLDNWYFVGGGSQLGDGVFPINQRGQTTYQNFDTSIDRWKNDSLGNLTVALESDGISLTEQGTENVRGYFDQRIADTYEQFVGKTLTATILLSNNTLLTGTCVWNKGTYTIPGNGNVQLRLYWYVNVKQIGFTIDVFHTKSEKIKAAKFELGSEQTLCHNEGTEQNPVWVLNEIPDYGEELAKCQRYLCKVDFTGACYSAANSASAYTVVATPVKMAGQTHLVNTSFEVGIRFETKNISNCTLGTNATRGNGVGITIYPPSGETFPSAKPGVIASGETLLSCEP